MNISELKDYLRLNNQMLKGNKPELVAKCVDGEKNGRLLPCKTCGKGKLVFAQSGDLVCSGYFDESIDLRMTCPARFDPAEARRDKWLIPGVDDLEDAEGNDA